RRFTASRKNNVMQFLRRHQFLLCFMGVLVLCSVMVIRQFLANQSAHVELREDFILLANRGDGKSAEHLYQLLILKLPDLNERSLVEDLERTAMLVDPKAPDAQNLIWKYQTSVEKEIQRRSERRIGRALERAEKK